MMLNMSDNCEIILIQITEWKYVLATYLFIILLPLVKIQKLK